MNALSTDSLSALGLTAASKKNAGMNAMTGAAPNAADSEEKKKKDKLGQADFLVMMTEQLKNQDPLNPMDNSAFLAQLAQFSQVQGLTDLNKKADQFIGAMGSDQALRGAALIGRKVEVPGAGLELGASGDVGGNVNVTAKGPVNIVVQDANGVPVRSLQMANQAVGNQPFSWDGKDNAGNRVPAGTYSVVATQPDDKGNPVKLDTSTDATVDSVSLDKDGVHLNIRGGKSVELKQVQRIS